MIVPLETVLRVAQVLELHTAAILSASGRPVSYPRFDAATPNKSSAREKATGS
jgi:hypothetical protein